MKVNMHRSLLGVVRDRLPRPLRRSLGTLRDEVARWRDVPGLARILREIAPYSMVAQAHLAVLAQQVVTVVRENIPGDFVECGVWRGGSAFLIARVLGELGVTDRKVWLVDSFEGLPPPEAIDGKPAQEYAAQTDAPRYFDNCRADLEDVQAGARKLGVFDQTRYVKGWFDQSLPTAREEIGPIALLRIDADWYASVMTCLDNLYDQVSANGFVILDDYYTWEGCSIATHEFLAKRKLPHRLYANGSAYFRKTS